MKYTIVTAPKPEDLIQKVNDLIQSGWVPQGGVCESGNSGTYYCQAMIKK